MWPRLVESLTVQAGQTSGTVIRCGLTDTLLADVPVSVVFLYQDRLNAEHLKDGLTTALRHVPAFAGRLRNGGDRLEIVCADQGVPMAVYDVDETLPEAVGRLAMPVSGFTDPIDFAGARAGEQPLATVRVSNLGDGGTAVGFAWHHTVGDMQTVVTFLRTWSAAVDGTPLPDVVVPTDRDAFMDDVLPEHDCGRPGFRLPDAEEAEQIRRAIATSLAANRTVQIYFSPSEVHRMRQKFSAEAGRSLTANDVLCAHVVSTIRALDDDTSDDRHLTMPADIRRRLGLPGAVLGNLVGEIHLPAPASTKPEALAATIRSAVDTFVDSQLNIRTNRRFLTELGLDRLLECVPVGFDPSRKMISVSNWSRFGAMDVTFGGAKPVLFSAAPNPPLPWVSWLTEGFEGDGFLCTVVLPAKLAVKVRGPAGKAAMHSHREPGDLLPALAEQVRKLV